MPPLITPPIPSPPPSRTLKILLWNTQLLPSLLTPRSTTSTASRAALISPQLHAYDLIVLNEAFSSTRALIRSCAGTHPHVFAPSCTTTTTAGTSPRGKANGWGWGWGWRVPAVKVFGSGLLVLSRWPFVDGAAMGEDAGKATGPGTGEFEAFERTAGVDRWANKGIACVAVQIPLPQPSPPPPEAPTQDAEKQREVRHSSTRSSTPSSATQPQQHPQHPRPENPPPEHLTIQLFGTHMQAERTPSAQSARRAQAQQLSSFVTRQRRKITDVLAILAGDLNMGPALPGSEHGDTGQGKGAHSVHYADERDAKAREGSYALLKGGCGMQEVRYGVRDGDGGGVDVDEGWEERQRVEYQGDICRFLVAGPGDGAGDGADVRGGEKPAQGEGQGGDEKEQVSGEDTPETEPFELELQQMGVRKCSVRYVQFDEPDPEGRRFSDTRPLCLTLELGFDADAAVAVDASDGDGG